MISREIPLKFLFLNGNITNADLATSKTQPLQYVLILYTSLYFYFKFLCAG